MAGPSDNTYMSNLPEDATEARITEVFSLYGTVVSVKVMQGGSALVRFESVEEAESIVTQMSGAVPLGFEEPVTIKFADRGAEAPKGASKGASPAAPAGYGKWKMAEKKLTTPWSIPGQPAPQVTTAKSAPPWPATKGGKGGLSWPVATPKAPPSLLNSLGATSTASKGKGKGGKPGPTPAEIDPFDQLAAAYESGHGNEMFAAVQAQPQAQAQPADDFDSLFAQYSSGGEPDFSNGAGSELAPPTAAPGGVSWAVPGPPAQPSGWAPAPIAGGWAPAPCAGVPTGWADPDAALPVDPAAWNGVMAGVPDVSPWDAEEAAWLSQPSPLPGVAPDASGGQAEWGGGGMSDAVTPTWSLGAAAAAATASHGSGGKGGGGGGGGGGKWGSDGGGGGQWGGGDPPPCDNLYIKGLPAGIDENWLTEALSGIGTVTSVRILEGNIVTPEGAGTCAAMARFDTVETATSVRDILDGQSPEWCPGKIVAKFAQQKAAGPGAVSPADAWNFAAAAPISGKGGDFGDFGKGADFGKGGKGGKGGKLPDSRADRLCLMVEETHVLPGDAHRSPEASVYVAGLPGDTTEKHVYQLFAPFGAIISVHTKGGQHGKGGQEWKIAFVNYVEPMSAHAAIQVYNGFQLPDGSVMKVNLKQAKGVMSQPLQPDAALAAYQAAQAQQTLEYATAPAPMEQEYAAAQMAEDPNTISMEQIQGLLDEASRPMA